MKKDIRIQKAENLYLAIVQEYNEAFKFYDYYAYLINKKDEDLEMVLVVSQGFDNDKRTSIMRHKIEKLPAHSIAKVELIQAEVLQLNNEFKVTFFEKNKMFEKNFTVAKNALKDGNLRLIKSLNKKGVLFN